MPGHPHNGKTTLSIRYVQVLDHRCAIHPNESAYQQQNAEKFKKYLKCSYYPGQIYKCPDIQKMVKLHYLFVQKKKFTGLRIFLHPNNSHVVSKTTRSG